jgi:type II secretory pathway pseudopilin PulG
MIKKNSTKSGYTLVETLVAITVLMIAIAGPLTVASKALNAAQDAKNQLIASNLAQESMEYLKNWKDNKVQNDPNNWPGTLLCQSTSASVPTCGVQTDISAPSGYTIGSCAPTCRMYQSSLGYTYNSGGATISPFTRYYYLSNLSITDPIITVVVSWTTGTTPNQIQLQEIMSNVAR